MTTNELDLSKVIAQLNTYKQTTSKGENQGGIIAGLVVLVLFIIVVAIFAFQAWRSGKERAKLLHEKAIREEAAHQAKVDAELQENTDKVDELLDKHDELQEEVLSYKTRIEEAERVHASAIDQINSITSWDQIDEMLKSTEPLHP